MNSSSEVIMLLKSIFIASLVGSIVIYLILAISYSKIFKANGEKGWKGFIPIVNIWTLMKLSDMNPLAIFLLIIPVVNLFVLALLSVKLANKFSKSAGFAIGLLFLPFIFYPLLALSFSPKKEKSKEKIINEEKEKTVICPICGTELKNGEKKCYVCDAEIESNKDALVQNDEKVDAPKEGVVESSYENQLFSESANNIENVDTGIAENNTFNETNQSELEHNIFNETSQNQLENNDFMETKQNVFENNTFDEISNSDLEQHNIQDYKDKYFNDYMVKENDNVVNNSTLDNIFKETNVIEHNKEIYRNPLDSNFDDIFFRNNNEESLSKKSIEEDEKLFNEKVNNEELNINEIGVISNYNKTVKPTSNINIEEKPKYKSSTKTLDEILKINQNLYNNPIKSSVNNKSINNDAENINGNDDLMVKINELNKEIEEGLKEIREEKPKVKICKVCGTTIPSYSEKCLLCGSPND